MSSAAASNAVGSPSSSGRPTKSLALSCGPRRPSPLRQIYLPDAARQSIIPFRTGEQKLVNLRALGPLWGWRAVSTYNDILLQGSCTGLKRTSDGAVKVSVLKVPPNEIEIGLGMVLEDDDEVEIVMGAFTGLGLAQSS